MTRVTLYGKAGCCLHARYGERIPVVAIDGRDELELGVDAEDLRERLDRVAP